MPKYTLTPFSGSPIAINDAGDVVAQSYDFNTNKQSTFIQHADGSTTPLTGPPGNFQFVPTGINNQGAVVGFFDYSQFDNQTHAFIYQNGTYAIVDYPGADPQNKISTQFYGINNTGTILGYSSSIGNFTYKDGTYTAVAPRNPPQTVFSGRGINDSGTIVGTYFLRGKQVGFAITNGRFKTIQIAGAAATTVTGINDKGEIVGFSENNAGQTRGFVISKGVVTRFKVGTAIYGINNLGQFVGGGSAGAFVGAPAGRAAQAAALAEAPVALCFVTGTRIRTTRGEVAVEALAVGDRVVTATGAVRPVRWIGHRELGGRGHRLPHDQQPICVRTGAFAPNVPDRDLLLSPGHPVLGGADEDKQGGHLVPIMCLVNGTSVRRRAVDGVTYWHVELDAHDILLAEGLPAESYLDWGDRAFFTEGADHALADPDFVVPGLGNRCRPVATCGPVVETERRRLDAVFAASLAAACLWPSEAELPAFG